MKRLIQAALIVLLSSTAAYATGAGQTEGLSTLAIVFLVFGATILVFQLIPGLALFFAMIKGLFASSDKEARGALGGAEKK